jgi:hypothetical protein
MEERVMRKLFILFAAVAFAFAFTAPAKAEVAISGYIAFQTYMEDIDEVAPTRDTSDLIWDNDNVCSRLTFAFKEGPFGGLVEMRPLTANMVRHWWGTWNFGAGTFGIGQTWTPDFNPIGYDKYGCGAMSGLGAGGSVRLPMAQLQFGSFKVGFGKPSTAMPANLPAGYTDTETSLPKIMASYNLNIAMVGLTLFGGMNSVDARDPATDATIGVDSYMAGLNVALGFGPLTVKGQVWTAENPLEYGTGGDGYLPANAGGTTTINDADYMAYGISLAYKVSDAWTVTAGYMLANAERTDGTVKTEDDTSQYHVNATWRAAKNVYISPEYIVFDRDDIKVGTSTTEECKDTRYGVYWRITF